MRCPQSRPATISCRQTMAMSKPSGGVAAGIGAAGIGAAGGAGERRRLNVPIINAHDQRPSAKYAGGRTVHLSDSGAPLICAILSKMRWRVAARSSMPHARIKPVSSADQARTGFVLKIDAPRFAADPWIRSRAGTGAHVVPTAPRDRQGSDLLR
jgi:hypothetical protein